MGTEFSPPPADGLRKGGATDKELEAIYGWENPKEAAMHKLITNETAPLSYPESAPPKKNQNKINNIQGLVPRGVVQDRCNIRHLGKGEGKTVGTGDQWVAWGFPKPFSTQPSL